MALRVLIVDDSPATRFMLRDVIEADGHQVVAEAETVDAAVAAYREHRPDVVTLDLSLADGDGLTVLRSLRQLDAQVKVLVITGNAQQKVMEEIAAAGACGVLPKPIDFDRVVDAIVRAASGPSA